MGKKAITHVIIWNDVRGEALSDLDIVDPLCEGRKLLTKVIEVPQRDSLAGVALWR